MLSPQLIEDLQQIIREEYDRDLPLEQVEMIGTNLIGYFDLLAEMHHKSTTIPEQEAISTSSETTWAETE